MVEYKCNRCQKIFNKKSNYKYHINRKNPCKINSHNALTNDSQNVLKYECHLCHKVLTRKSNLTRHINLYCKVKKIERKIENTGRVQNDTIYIHDDNDNDNCNIVFDDQEHIPPHKTHNPHKNAQHKSQYTCEYCHKMFTRRDTLTRHKKKYCKVRKENEEDMKKLLNKLVKQMEEQNNDIGKLKKENKKLHKKVDTLESGSTTLNNTHKNSHNITNNVQNNINLLSFGKDNTEGISNEEIKAILKRGFNSIQLITKKTNFDPNIPENHNVYINNIKSQYAITYNKGRWVLDKTEDVIDRIYDDKYYFLEGKYQELKDKLTPYDRKKIERILDQYEGIKKIRTFEEIRLILYNNRHIPLKTRRLLENK